MTKRLYIDLETYSDVDLFTHGTVRYAERAEILLVAYAIDDGPARVLDCTHETTPAFVKWPADLVAALEDKSVEIVAHNAFFDRTVGNRQGIPTALERWRCTMVKALQHGLPGSLGTLCAIFKVDSSESKKDGKELIQLFCKPPPKNHKRPRATRLTHPKEWADFIEYARLDVEAMRAVDKKMPSWNCTPFERELWLLDQKINDRGFAVDLELAEAAVELVAAERKKIAARTQEVTDGEVESTTQRDKLLAHLLAEHGVTLPDLTKSTVERRLNDPDLPEPVRELLLMRQDAAGTAVNKYKTLLRVASDGRVRGALQFCGAMRTGRWAGRMFQPQNLTRPPKHLHGHTEPGAAAIKAGIADLLYDNVVELAGAIVRGAIIAPPEKKLVVADLAGIEGRVIAWLAGEKWKIQAYRDLDAGAGFDMYALAYARGFDVEASYVMEDKERGGNLRQIGKVMELALGFQGAEGAFNSMAALYGVELPLSKVRGVVRAWRESNPNIVAFWYALDEAAIHVVEHGGLRDFGYVTNKAGFRIKKKLPVTLDKKGNWLRIRLPSGRYLCYPSPRLEPNRFDRLAVTYMGVNQYTRKWERLSTYGGKFAENITQAVARDVLAEAMIEAEGVGYDLVLTVHDEILTEVDVCSPWSAEDLCRIMATPRDWCKDLPLAAGGFETLRYRKE